MDEAWRLERELWESAVLGRAAEFYARHMTADGFMVVPGEIIDRQDLIGRWGSQTPLTQYQLSEPRLVLVDGESVLVTYGVTAEGRRPPKYRAHVTALYTWSAGRWALTFRQHTPEGNEPLAF